MHLEPSALLRMSPRHFVPHLVAMSTVFFFPPMVPIRFAQQLFTGEAAGSKPVERFMQIERSGPFDESFPAARKFEVVDPHR